MARKPSTQKPNPKQDRTPMAQILDAALSLGAPEAIGRNLNFTHAIFFGAKTHG